MNRLLCIITSLLILIIVIENIFFNHFHQDNKSRNPISMEEQVEKGTDDMLNINKITLTINDKKFTVVLENNQTAQDFIEQLPLSIEMNDLNGNEKYYYLDETLFANESQVERIEKGDIMLFGNDCLVVFYQSFPTSYSYTKIGKIEHAEHLDEIVGSGTIKMYFSK